MSCLSPTILPEVSSISKVDCTGVNSVYKSLIAALDKVLRLYDLQEKFLESDTSNSSVEIRALQIVINTLMNQTCNWIESLGLRYSGSNESLTCTSGAAQIRKLHTLVSTYQLMEEARHSTTSYVGNITMRPRNWLRTSGVQPHLNTLLNGTVYQDSLLLRNSCQPPPQCSQ